MLRLLRSVLALYVAIVLQTVLAPALEVFGVRPDFPFVLVVAVALWQGPAAGAAFGFVAGLFVDSASAGALGVTSLVNCLVGFAVGSLAERFVRENLGAKLVVTFLATFVREQLLVFMLPPHGILDSIVLLVRSSIPGALYTAVFAPVVLGLAERFFRAEREPSRVLR